MARPFTADDVIFTATYASNPENSAYTANIYQNIRVEKLDDYTVGVYFSEPTPFWPDAFVGTRGMILPKHKFEAYQGERSREAPTNLKAVGTSAFILEEFRPGDALTARMNPNYHVANRPYFDRLEIKGGGDAVSAARAVLQTGEYDFAWNLTVEKAFSRKLRKAMLALSQSLKGPMLSIFNSTRQTPGQRLTANVPTFPQTIRLLATKRCVKQWH